MQIRLAVEQDIPTIAQFQMAMAMETEQKILPEETVVPGVAAVFAEPSRGFYLVAELQGRVASSLLVTYEWSDWRNCNIWYVQSVYVDREFRGQGIFRQMYAWVVEQAKAAGTSLIRLYVETENQRAQSVYESVGMEKLPYFMYEANLVGLPQPEGDSDSDQISEPA